MTAQQRTDCAFPGALTYDGITVPLARRRQSPIERCRFPINLKECAVEPEGSDKSTTLSLRKAASACWPDALCRDRAACVIRVHQRDSDERKNVQGTFCRIRVVPIATRVRGIFCHKRATAPSMCLGFRAHSSQRIFSYPRIMVIGQAGRRNGETWSHFSRRACVHFHPGVN